MPGYTVHLTDSVTGKEATQSEPYEWSRYWWGAGNMGCDCNRSTSFDLDVPCNTGPNRFRITRVVLAGGSEIEDAGELNDQ